MRYPDELHIFLLVLLLCAGGLAGWLAWVNSRHAVNLDRAHTERLANAREVRQVGVMAEDRHKQIVGLKEQHEAATAHMRLLAEESAEWERQCETHRVKAAEIEQWQRRCHEAERNATAAVAGRMAAEEATATVERRLADVTAKRNLIAAQRDAMLAGVTQAKQALCGFPAEEGADEGAAAPEEVRKTWGWQRKDADERKLTGARRS